MKHVVLKWLIGGVCELDSRNNGAGRKSQQIRRTVPS